MAIQTYRKDQSEEISTNFKTHEFHCHGNGCCQETQIDTELVKILQKVRDHFGKPVHINSAYRCPTHNSRIGSGQNSQHRYGRAADFYVEGVTPLEVAKYLESIGVKGLGLYEGNDGNFVHADTRTSKAFWYGHAQKPRTTFGGTISGELQAKEDAVLKTELQKEISSNSEEYAKKIWDYLYSKINNPYGVAGLMGNLYAESALCSNNLENAKEKKLGYNDSNYTESIDNGVYKNFVKDSAGYGLAQWTYWSRKQGLLKKAQQKKASIGDYNIQLEYLMDELQKDYKSVLNVLKTAKTIEEASNKVLFDFEAPRDQSPQVQAIRAEYSRKYFNCFAEETYRKQENIKTYAGTGIGMATAKTAMTIRLEPAIKGKSLAVIKKGDMVEVLEKLDNGWYRIVWDNAPNKYAYTSNETGNYYSYASFDEDELDESDFMVKVTASLLNVRAEPNTSSSIMDTLRNGTIHTITQEVDGWGLLKSGKGWIKLLYTQRLNNA